MPKDGQHNDDAHDYDKSKGTNNPDKSVTISTGTPKKQETYLQQAAEGENPAKQAQAARNEWNEDTRDEPTTEGSTRARESDLSKSGRGNRNSSGSKSNAERDS
jgi:hypothetical protein